MQEVTPARKAFERAVAWALGTHFMCGNNHKALYRMALSGGRWPERILPGRMIMRMSPEDQEALKDLKPEETQDRVDPYMVV